MTAARCLTIGIILLACGDLSAQDPFAKISYDSVVAYNFAMVRPRVTILQKDSTLDNTTVLPGHKLERGQVKNLLKIVNNKKTYGGTPFACFDPKHAFIFYRGKSIVGLIEICFVCNFLRSSPQIPALLQYMNNGEAGVLDYGFSEKGVKQLRELCLDVGLREK